MKAAQHDQAFKEKGIPPTPFKKALSKQVKVSIQTSMLYGREVNINGLVRNKDYATNLKTCTCAYNA